MIWVALLLAAPVQDTAENIRELKAQERSLLDDIDDRIQQRRSLEKRAKVLKAQLQSMEATVARAQERLREDSAVYARVALDAHKRARQMDKLLRGHAARFVLGASGISEGIKRSRIVQRAFRRDAQLLTRALWALSARKAVVNALDQDKRRAEALYRSAQAVRAEIETTTKALAGALMDIRGRRAGEEQKYYDLREFEARLQRESEEEMIAATDPFIGRKGKLPWPVMGRKLEPNEVGPAGVRILSRQGEAMRAVAAGVVEWTGSIDGYAQVAIVRHSPNYTSVYGGLASVALKSGDTIDVGALLGRLAESGIAYFELRQHTVPQNASHWLESR